MIRAPLAIPSLLFLSGVAVVRGETPKVAIGYCAQLREIDAVRAAGFDYVELRTSEVAGLSDAEFEALAEGLRRDGPPVPVTYLFIPGSIKVTGPAVDEEQQRSYLRKALARVARLGAETVVFGSGPARQVPEGFPKKEAFEQLVGFCKRLAPEARSRNLVIAIEPQRREECNIVNTVAEGLELVRAVDDPSIQLTVDFYHLAMEKEDPAIVVAAASHVRHLHMANPEGRVFPLDWKEYAYAPFFESLRKIGYRGRMSVEARAQDFPGEAPRTIAFLRSAFVR